MRTINDADGAEKEAAVDVSKRLKNSRIDEIATAFRDMLGERVPLDAMRISMIASVVYEVRRIGMALDLSVIEDEDARKEAFVAAFGCDKDYELPPEIWKERCEGAYRVAESVLDGVFDLAYNNILDAPTEIHKGQKYLYLDLDGGEWNGKICEATENAWIAPAVVRFKSGDKLKAAVGTLWRYRKPLDLSKLVEKD